MTSKAFDKDKLSFFIDKFQENMPNPKSELHYDDVYQLLVAVVLSAQCTDKRVNMITPQLFAEFPNITSLSKAKVDDVFQLIKSCTYPNNKSKNLVALSNSVINSFGGVIPDTREDLMSLPGVGRKTANVVMAVAYHQPCFAVDTHVFRVANRIGLSHASTPEATEKQLTNLFPPNLIPDAHHWLLLHGRYCCKAQKPQCDKCIVSSVCDYKLSK